MSIEKRNTGYTVRWRDTQGRQRSKQVQLYRDAVQFDAEMKRRRAMGELLIHERGNIRTAEFYELWRERYGKVHVTARTLAGYEQLWSSHVAPAIGRMKLSEITPETVAALVAALSGRLAPSSIRKVVAVLQGVLQRAVEWGYIRTNPAIKVRKPPLVTREGRALTAEQLDALVSELPTVRGQVVARVLAGTGLRPGELRALDRGDIRDGKILVTKAVSQSMIGPTKTKQRRAVLVRPEVERALAEWHLAEGCPMGGLVFPGHTGRVWTDGGWRMWQQQVFTPAAKRAGFDGLVPYDLRHTFASTLIAEGRDIYWIARQLGHAPTMTLTTYGHLFEQESWVPELLEDAL